MTFEKTTLPTGKKMQWFARHCPILPYTVLPLKWRVLEMCRLSEPWSSEKLLLPAIPIEPWTPLFGDFSLLCITCSFHLPYLFCCFIPLESFGIIIYIYVTCFSFAVQLFSIQMLIFWGAAEHGERGGPLMLWGRDYFTPWSANCRMHLATLHKLNPNFMQFLDRVIFPPR